MFAAGLFEKTFWAQCCCTKVGVYSYPAPNIFNSFVVFILNRSWSMCRNIKQLRDINNPPSAIQIEQAALQYVRKVSGYTRPSKVNMEVYNRTVEEIAVATRRLLEDLVILPQK
jgi:hypothetical protein